MRRFGGEMDDCGERKCLDKEEANNKKIQHIVLVFEYND